MRIGVLGGGQLGRMLALAGYPLGLRFRFLDPSADAPVAALSDLVVGGYSDAAALDRFAEGLDVATYEFENVPVEAVEALEHRGLAVRPGPAALAAAQDRLEEKEAFRRLGIPTAAFERVDDAAELASAAQRLGTPLVVKTRRLGYDGKGQRILEDPTAAERVWADLGAVPLIAEELVDFERELSILAVRRAAGELAFYPLVQNEHEDGILRISRAPAPNAAALQEEAERYAARLLDELRFTGVLAIELFEAGGRLLANEMAPRVHNSGHWTLEGAETSQFENHLRGILDLPLGAADARGHAAMVNLIGEVPPAARILALRGAHLHLYQKRSRPGRKLGHVTLVDADPGALGRRLEALAALVRAAEPALDAPGGAPGPPGPAKAGG